MSLAKRMPFQYAANPRNRNSLDILALAAARGATDYDLFVANDASCMFQDLNAQSPVTTLGQSIALIFGQRYKGARGADLLGGDGSFASSAGWTFSGGWTIAGGTLNHVGTSTAIASHPITTSLGGAFEVTYTCTTYTSGGFTASLNPGGTGTARASAATFTEIIYPNANAPTTLRFTPSGTGVFSIDNVTVKPILGYNMRQATPGLQPTWTRNAAGIYIVQQDGVDDTILSGRAVVLPALPHYICATFLRTSLTTATIPLLGACNSGTGHGIAGNSATVDRINTRFSGTASPSGGTAITTNFALPPGTTYGLTNRIVTVDSLVVAGLADGIVETNTKATQSNTWAGGDVGAVALSLFALENTTSGTGMVVYFSSWGYAYTDAERLAIRRACAKLGGRDL